jgi:three-Cys-motif partner protein
MKRLRYDVIGYWSEVKLDIIKEYASAYTKIMAAQKSPRFKYIYIDAFAGAGKHISRETRDMVVMSINLWKLPSGFYPSSSGLAYPRCHT